MSVATATDAEVIQDWDALDDAGEEREAEATPSPTPAEQRVPEQDAPSPDTTAQRETVAPQGETQDERATRLAELEKRNAELEAKMAAREWSSEGRYRAELKRRELLEAELTQVRQRSQDEDGTLRSQYQAAIDRANAEDNPIGARALAAELDAQLAKRELARVRQDQERTSKEAQELAALAKNSQLQQAGEMVRQAAIPSLRGHVQSIVGGLELDADDTAILLGMAITPDMEYATRNYPPEVVGQMVEARWDYLIQQGEAMKQRQVARNQQAGRANGDFTRETGGAGPGRGDLDKAFEEADFEDALAMVSEGYTPPVKGKRRR